MKKEQDHDFTVPENFLKQLQEFTNGGYIMFAFTKNGFPVNFSYFESVKDRLALETFVERFVEASNRERIGELGDADEELQEGSEGGSESEEESEPA